MLNSLRQPNVARCLEVFHTSLDDWSIAEWACAAAGECGEVCDAVKKLKRLETGTNTDKDPQTHVEAIEKIGNEIADTIIYLDLLAARLDIDIDEAIVRKFNAVSKRMNSSIYL